MALVSVVLPVFNGQRYLELAVQSILSQTLSDLELIAVDDGSTDASLPLLNRFAQQDPRVRVISRKNTGIEIALNDGVAAATAPFVARMDSDDIAMPDRLDRQLRFMQSHQDVVLLGGAYRLIDGAGRFLTVLHPPTDNESLQQQLLSGRNPFCHPLVMMRREAVGRAGAYRTDLPAAEDLDLWLRMGEIGQVACLADVLLDYRIHSSSISESKQATQISNLKLACERACQRRGIQCDFQGANPWRPLNNRASRHDFSLRYGWWAFNSGQRRTAMIYGAKAIAIKPWNQSGWRLLACAALKSTQQP